MQTYIGVKIIEAEQGLSQKDIGDWPAGSDGYYVVYEDGYESWIPKNMFEKAYRPVSVLTFGLAVEAMIIGKKVARSGWNGKGMWLFLVNSSEYQIDNHDVPLSIQYGQSNVLSPWIAMKTADDKFVPWLASQTDVLAEDYYILD